MYRHQHAKVKWDNIYFDGFTLKNGVKQGAVLSAILYCIYVDDLYHRLRSEKYGILGYSDDILLLSPNISALKKVLQTCEKFAVSHNLQFSTDLNPSKSKCSPKIRTLELCGHRLPWVDTIKHLGTTVSDDNDLLARDMQKRAAFINRNNELLQEFNFAHPKSLVKINNIYNSSSSSRKI